MALNVGYGPKDKLLYNRCLAVLLRQSSFSFRDLSWLSGMTHCPFPHSCCNGQQQREPNVLCLWPRNTIPSETDHLFFWHLSPLPTWGGYFSASGIIILEPFPRETRVYMAMTSLPVPQPNKHNNTTNTHTQALVLFMMQTRAEITGSSGSVWEYTPQRWSYTGRWSGRHGMEHTQTNTHWKIHSAKYKPTLGLCQQTNKQRHANTLTITHSKWHGQTLYCAHPQTITHSHTHTARFVSAASRGRISVGSSSVAPATGSRKGKRISRWSTSQFRQLLRGQSRGR